MTFNPATHPSPTSRDAGQRQQHYEHTHFSRINAGLVLGVAAAGGLLLYMEGYLALLEWPFAVYSVLVALMVYWVGAFDITTRRLIALFGVAGALGLVTQWVGATRNAFWHYPEESYWFVAPMFMFAAAAAYGISVSSFGEKLRQFGLSRKLKAWQAAFLSLSLLAVVLWGAQPISDIPSVLSYYLVLATCSFLLAWLADFATVVALVGAAVLVGAISETLGAASGLWTFGARDPLPPAYLIFGSWPLEIATHYALSAVMTRESLLPRRRYFQEHATYEPVVDHPMSTTVGSQKVVIVEGDDKFELLERALAQSGLQDALERRAEALGTTRDSMRIAIKPNFMFMYAAHDRSTFTDPELVERLVDWLRQRGYRDIAVVEAQSAYGNYFLDREVQNVAKVVGYAPEGRYRIVDLTLEKVPHQFRGPLGRHSVGATWKDADFRISFAKNKTHTWAWYTLTLKNIYGALPEQNKIWEYHYAREIYSPTIDLLVEFPVHFGIIDAFESADGPFGIFADRKPNPTRTLLAGENLVALDWVGAQKMGLDPMVSRYMQLAVQVFGKPTPSVEGNLSPYSPWENVPKQVIDFWDLAEESYGFTNTVFFVLNRDYMGPEFRRRPTTKLLKFLLPLIAPVGGLVYQDPLRRAAKGRLGAAGQPPNEKPKQAASSR